MVAKSVSFTLVDDVLYFVNAKRGHRKCVVVPGHGGVGKVKIVYQPGRENDRADALSQNLCGSEEGSKHLELGVQVCQVMCPELEMSELLEAPPETSSLSGEGEDFTVEQRKDGELLKLCEYLERGVLPADSREAWKMVAKLVSFTLVDNVLYFVNAKRGNRKRVVVPGYLQQAFLAVDGGGPL